MKRVAETTIKNGFRKTGLFPFNVEAVDFSRCLHVSADQSEGEGEVTEPIVAEQFNYKEAFRCVRNILGEDKLQKGLRNELSPNEYSSLLTTLAEKAGQPIDGISVQENAVLVDISSEETVVHKESHVTEDNEVSLPALDEVSETLAIAGPSRIATVTSNPWSSDDDSVTE